MKLERWRGERRYTVEAHSPDRGPLDALQARWPGAYIQWEAMGVPVARAGGGSRLSGPTWVL